MEIILLIGACVFFYFRSTKHLVSALRTGLEESCKNGDHPESMKFVLRMYFKVKGKGFSAPQIYEKLKAISQPSDSWISSLVAYIEGMDEDSGATEDQMRESFEGYVLLNQTLLKKIHNIG